MNRILLSIISGFLYTSSAFALPQAEVPDMFLVKSESTHLLNKQLITGDQSIGLLTLAPGKKGTFYYFDAQNQLQNTFVLKRKNPALLEFEVLDQYQKTVAYFDIHCNPTSALVSGLALYTADKKTVVLVALPSLFSIKDLFIEADKHTIGKIRRHFFDSDLEVGITDKERFLSRATQDIDLNVLTAVLAFTAMPTKTLDVDLF